MKKKELTLAEEEAARWAKQYYPHWRKRFGGTRERHNAQRPRDIPEDIWDAWYLAPFGVPEWNRNIAIVRRLLAEKAV